MFPNPDKMPKGLLQGKLKSEDSKKNFEGHLTQVLVSPDTACVRERIVAMDLKEVRELTRVPVCLTRIVSARLGLSFFYAEVREQTWPTMLSDTTRVDQCDSFVDFSEVLWFVVPRGNLDICYVAK